MTAKQNVAILGGGMGGIATAWALTELPKADERFDITVYQMGWRLGGKGASGRNAQHHQRIEEHGLHVWLGFYDNSFKAMKRAYEELGRKPGTPLADWQDAFKKHSVIALMENWKGEWKPWQLEFPENDFEPGVPSIDPFPDAWGYVKMLLKWLLGHYESEVHEPAEQSAAAELRERSWLEKAFASLERELDDVVEKLEAFAFGATGAAALHAAVELAHEMPEDVSQHDKEHHGIIEDLLEEFLKWLDEEVEHALDTNDDLRRAWYVLSMGVAIARGMIADDVIFKGFKAVTKWDFRDWLGRHGASETIQSCVLIWALYDLVFAFEGGDPKRANFNAGMALRSIFSMLFEYKGAIFWEMQAGMGDTVFTPFYRVLKQRGVRFEFFHKVENLGLSPDKNLVQTIRVQRQVWLKDHENEPCKEYRPLCSVRDLECWPSAADLSQVDPEQAEEIRKGNINLESYYSGWKGAETRELKLGEHFDTVVLAIPPGAHPFICPELMEHNQGFGDMSRNLKTVQTQALQLWLYPGLHELGWPGPKPVLDAYQDSLNTWSDMSHLIVREDWPSGDDGGPRSIAYFCGPRLDAPDTPTPKEAREGKATWFPRRENERQEAEATEWLEQYTGGLWPKATRPDDSRALDYGKLVAEAGTSGDRRLQEQYFRANYEPSERYVLSVAGSDDYRLKPGDSGFLNLFLAGDWCDNGYLNAGAIEPTMMSALLAARAISGDEIEIMREGEEI